MQQHAGRRVSLPKRRLQIVVQHFRVDLCSSKWAPRGVHCFCCFLTKSFTHQLVHRRDSAKAVLQIRTRVLNEDWEDTFRGWYPGFRPKLENEIKQAA